MNKNDNIPINIKHEFFASTYLCDGVVSSLHFHNVYEMYYLEKGNRTYLINGKSYTTVPGTFILIPPGTPHQTSGAAFKRRLIHFSKSLLEKIFDANYITKLLLPFEKNIFISPSKNHEYILDMFNHAELAFTTNDSDAFVLETAKLLNFISKQTDITPQQTTTNLLVEIENYIQENACEIKNLEDIADKFFISKFHLCHLFKQKKNVTVMSYIMDIKIQKSAEMLVNTDKKSKEIAQLMGFNSEYYFSKCFSSVLGISPSKYRLKFRNKSKEKTRNR